MRTESLDEKGKGLWANIHDKRKKGKKPARKGSKAYKKAKAAADKLNNEELNHIKTLESFVSEAFRYDMNFEIGDTVDLLDDTWEIISTMKPNKKFKDPFTFQGEDMEMVPVYPPSTNKKAEGYKVRTVETRGYTPQYGFLYQYVGTNKKLYTKLAIVGVNESVNEGYHTFQGEMARDLKEKGVKLKKGDKVNLEIQPNNYVIYGPNRKQVVLDKRDFEGKIDQYVIYESVNEGRDDVVFVIDDGNLDNKFLMTRSLSRNLDYQHDSGDQYYVLPKRDFDRLEDYADSHGYDSESIYVIDESEELNEFHAGTEIGKWLADNGVPLWAAISLIIGIYVVPVVSIFGSNIFGLNANSWKDLYNDWKANRDFRKLDANKVTELAKEFRKNIDSLPANKAKYFKSLIRKLEKSVGSDGEVDKRAADDVKTNIENYVKKNESVNEAKMPDKYIGNDEIVYLKTKEDSKGAHYNLYYKGHDIEAGGARFGSEKELEDFAANYILSNQWYKKLRYEDSIPLPESRNVMTLESFLNEELPTQEIDPNAFQNPYKTDKNFFKKGYKDENVMDDVVKTKPVKIQASQLKPSQDAVYLGKALGMAIGGVEGGNLEAVISQDNRILDGHHRWAATIFNNPKARVGGVQAELKIGDLVPVLRQAGDALGNKRGLPPKGGDQNIFKATLDDVKDAVYDGKYMNPQFYNRDKAVAWFEEKGEKKIQTALNLLQRVGPPAGAPPRADMPKIEPEQVQQVAKKLQGGAIDVRAPYVKEELNHLTSLESFIDEKKPGPDPYMTNLSKDDEEDKEEQMKKQAAMDDDDPNAYKDMPGDKEAREKGDMKKSKHTSAYHKKFKKVKSLEEFSDNWAVIKEGYNVDAVSQNVVVALDSAAQFFPRYNPAEAEAEVKDVLKKYRKLQGKNIEKAAKDIRNSLEDSGLLANDILPMDVEIIIMDNLNESKVYENLNKSDVAYQLAMDYSGNSKPKIVKLNKKEIHIKYGYKFPHEESIKSILKVHPDIELTHAGWSNSPSGGGIHKFKINESTINENTYLDASNEFVKELEKSKILASNIEVVVGPSQWGKPGELRFRDHVTLRAVGIETELYVIPRGSFTEFELYTDIGYEKGREIKIGDAKTIINAMKRYVNKMNESLVNEEKDNLYLQLHRKYAEQIKGLKAKKIKKLTDLVSVQRWSMEDREDYFDMAKNKKKELSAEYDEERRLFKKYMAKDYSVMLPKGTESLRESINEGEISDTFDLILDTINKYKKIKPVKPYFNADRRMALKSKGLENLEDIRDHLDKTLKDFTVTSISKGDNYPSQESFRVINKNRKIYSIAMDLEEPGEFDITYSDLNESVNEEKDQTNDKSKIDGEGIETGLKKKADETGVPIGILRVIMRRGMAAWKSGHRPGTNSTQWGYARVNSFLTKGDGTWGKADKDMAKEVRDGGHDKKL